MDKQSWFLCISLKNTASLQFAVACGSKFECVFAGLCDIPLVSNHSMRKLLNSQQCQLQLCNIKACCSVNSTEIIQNFNLLMIYFTNIIYRSEVLTYSSWLRRKKAVREPRATTGT